MEGKAKELIKVCFYMEPNMGYVKARKLLQEKYGDLCKISNAFIQKATDWPVLKPGDSIELERFSTFLTQCCSAME